MSCDTNARALCVCQKVPMQSHGKEPAMSLYIVPSGAYSYKQMCLTNVLNIHQYTQKA